MEELRIALSKGFGEPVHVEPREFIERVIAGAFLRQPDMSGDQRKRLQDRERRAVEDVAAGLMATFAELQNSALSKV